MHQSAISLLVSLFGLDSGDGGELIITTYTLTASAKGSFSFVHAHAKKDDSTQVERENWMVVRRPLGLYGSASRSYGVRPGNGAGVRKVHDPGGSRIRDYFNLVS